MPGVRHQDLQDRRRLGRASTERPDDPCAQAATLIREKDRGSVPVAQDGRLVGIVTDRGIRIRAVARGKNPRTGETIKEISEPAGGRASHARDRRDKIGWASSSAVEQGTLNPLVVGSNPSWLTEVLE